MCLCGTYHQPQDYCSMQSSQNYELITPRAAYSGIEQMISGGYK